MKHDDATNGHSTQTHDAGTGNTESHNVDDARNANGNRPATDTDDGDNGGSDGAVLAAASEGATANEIASLPISKRGSRPPLSREERRARAKDELARAKERSKKRKDKDRQRINDLTKRLKENDATEQRRRRKVHAAQEKLAKFRFAEAALKELARLPKDVWPAEISKVVAAASEEDRAAIDRLLEQWREAPSS